MFKTSKILKKDFIKFIPIIILIALSIVINLYINNTKLYKEIYVGNLNNTKVIVDYKSFVNTKDIDLIEVYDYNSASNNGSIDTKSLKKIYAIKMQVTNVKKEKLKDKKMIKNLLLIKYILNVILLIVFINFYLVCLIKLKKMDNSIKTFYNIESIIIVTTIIYCVIFSLAVLSFIYYSSMIYRFLNMIYLYSVIMNIFLLFLNIYIYILYTSQKIKNYKSKSKKISQ